MEKHPKKQLYFIFCRAKIVKISFKRKQFFIQLRREVVSQAIYARRKNICFCLLLSLVQKYSADVLCTGMFILSSQTVLYISICMHLFHMVIFHCSSHRQWGSLILYTQFSVYVFCVYVWIYLVFIGVKHAFQIQNSSHMLMFSILRSFYCNFQIFIYKWTFLSLL